jgi:hypothetical protein
MQNVECDPCCSNSLNTRQMPLSSGDLKDPQECRSTVTAQPCKISSQWPEGSYPAKWDPAFYLNQALAQVQTGGPSNQVPLPFEAVCECLMLCYDIRIVDNGSSQIHQIHTLLHYFRVYTCPPLHKPRLMSTGTGPDKLHKLHCSPCLRNLVDLLIKSHDSITHMTPSIAQSVHSHIRKLDASLLGLLGSQNSGSRSVHTIQRTTPSPFS